ncbi:MAG: TonB-dependent receptor [Verrucomicrobia bacterium]|nr:TonB-dependent receptor [Verrucomicrobiota bacterium]
MHPVMNLLHPPLARGFTVAMVCCLATANVRAGDIIGRVLAGASGNSLPGAQITVAETGQHVVADSEGRFQVGNLPAGAATLRVEYSGYSPKTERVTVPAAGAVSVSIGLEGDVVRLEKMVIEGYREGRFRAIQQKFTQINIADIISADSIGNLPDRNVSEATGRVPGVSTTGIDQGESAYVSIRGVEPNLNQVLLDGAIMAAPGGSRLGRAVPLDALAATQVSQIEVTKTVTPDMDANSLGGTVNIKTAGPFDREGRHVSGTVQGNYNETTEKTDLLFKVGGSMLFGEKKLWGIAAGVNYDKRSYSNHWLQTGWNARVIGTTTTNLPSGFEIKPEEGSLTRTGGNLVLEYRPEANTHFYLKPSYSKQERNEHTVEILYSVDNAANRVTMLSPTKALFDGTRTRSERRDFNLHKEQSVINVVGGIKKVIGDFTLEPMASWSGAKEKTPFNNVLAFRNNTGNTGPITIDWGTFDFVSFEVNPAVDTYDRYPLRRTREDSGLIDEKTATAKLDVKWAPATLLRGHKGYLKTGFKYLQRDREVNLESRRLVPVGNWTLGNIGANSILPSVPVYEGRYTSLFRLNPEPIWAYLRANPALTTVSAAEQAANSTEDDYSTAEYIYALYAMGSLTLDRLTLLGGLRWEQTNATIRAVEARTFGGAFVGYFPASGTSNFGEYCPNLQAVYRLTDRTRVRAAVTKTIGRPAYEDTRPFANFQFQALGGAALNPAFPYTGTLVVGNPDLKPFSAVNFDLSLEWYPRQTSGILAVAAFRKEIKNPIYGYSQLEEYVTYNGLGMQSLARTSRQNAKSGRISGVELNAYQPFKFLPSPWDGFGIDANLTFISSEAKVPTRPRDDIPFFRQPTKIRNLTLFYEKAGFSGRIAYTYSDRQLETLGNDLLNDRYRVPRYQIDLQFSYRITQHYSLRASVRNLTREKEQRSTAVAHLMQYSRLLDRDYKLGLDFNF